MQSLTAYEQKCLLSVLKERDTQDYLIVLVMLETGLRVSEALELRRADILDRDGRIVCARKKGSRKNCLPVSAECLGMLMWVIQHRPNPSDRLFNRNRRTLDWRIKRAAVEAGIPEHKAHAHAMKHSFCENALDDTGGNILAVQALAGHSDINSTLAYAGISTEKAIELRKSDRALLAGD
jgi:integrase